VAKRSLGEVYGLYVLELREKAARQRADSLHEQASGNPDDVALLDAAIGAHVKAERLAAQIAEARRG